LTLIELVVAMAIFALVAIMGLQSLTAMLRMRDRLTEMDAQTAALSRGISMMRNDLTAVLPLLFYPPDRALPRSALHVSGGGEVFSMSLGGQPELSGRIAMHRVDWRLDTTSGVLHRRIWSTLTPADSSAMQQEIIVLDGVDGLRLRSYWAGQGWVDGLSSPLAISGGFARPLDGDIAGGAAEVYSDILPDAIEVTLLRGAQGDVTLIESLQ
tara:strand:- start:115229 stop:115864 length:636 start_codon:yes stop_codon:yes gene_type:complete